MNDRFRFRAKRVDNNKFVYGYLCFIYIDNEKHCRVYSLDDAMSYDCYTKSLGQCVGLKDKNGRLIYEGDVITVDSSTININDTKAIVFFDEYEASFNLQWLPKGNGANALKRIKKLSKHGLGDTRWWEVEVIGNIHENPELLEDK